MNNRGLFIVLEGLDRCGKSTQVRLLCEALNGHRVQFPDRSTQMGMMISNYLKGTEQLSDQVIHLLFSANRWERQAEIASILDKGTHVICDRYAFSGVAYSAAKGLPLDWCKASDAGLPAPDVTIFLEAPMNVLSCRGDFGTERYENIEFQTKVGLVFEQLRDQMTYVDATQPIDAIQKEILDIVSKSRPQSRLLWN